jgi:hypothetical protein
MFRLAFRFAGLAAVALAFALLVKDATRSIAGGELALTPLGLDAEILFQAKFAQLQPMLERNVHPLLWDPVALTLLRLPTWLALGAFGALLFYALRPGRQRIGAGR